MNGIQGGEIRIGTRSTANNKQYNKVCTLQLNIVKIMHRVTIKQCSNQPIESVPSLHTFLIITGYVITHVGALGAGCLAMAATELRFLNSVKDDLRRRWA